MRKTLSGVEEVVAWRLCVGCGACVAACPSGGLELVDVPADGLRPRQVGKSCQKCGRCLDVCPGIGLAHDLRAIREGLLELSASWGPVLEIWEGYATDAEVRYKGSSGGAATALALFCLETGRAGQVLHIGACPNDPLRNIPFFSTDRDSLLAHTGSRYSPAGPCESFSRLRSQRIPSVFIGKPCDVGALRKFQALDEDLSRKVDLAVSIFCAGTPATCGTHQMLRVMGADPQDVEELRYRGHGWPGQVTAKLRGNREALTLSYEQAWGGILASYVPLRCRLCPDGTGEFADVSCGDPWYKARTEGEPGRSLVLVRTEKGRSAVREAVRTGYLALEPSRPANLAASQKWLLEKRQNLFGRLLAMKALGLRVPEFSGFDLKSNWKTLTWRSQVISVAGTFIRILRRGWFRPSTAPTTGGRWSATEAGENPGLMK